MYWQTWAESHRMRRDDANLAARALLESNLRPARSLLKAWSIPEDWLDIVLDTLRATPPAPPPEVARGHLHSLQGLDPGGRPRAGWLHYRWVLQNAPQTPADTLEARLTWALAEMARLGAEAQRRMAAVGEFSASPEDRLVAEMWRAWGAGTWGRTWSGPTVSSNVQRAWLERWAVHAARGELLASGWEEAWRCLLLSEKFRGASGVFRSRGLTQNETTRIAKEWDENMVIHMFGGGEGVPLRGLLASRVLELGSSEPMSQLCRCLSPVALAQVGSCVARRGSRAVTLRLLMADLPDQSARAARLTESLQSMPSHADRFIRMHTLRALGVAWGQQRSLHPDGAWSVILQHRLRGQSRLRAVAAGSDNTELINGLLELPGIAARTRSAMRLIGRACAHDAFRWPAVGEFEVEGWQQPLSPSCEPEPAPLTLLPESELPDLTAWVTLVALRGRLSMLLDWVSQGRNSGRDGRWNRLLSVIPESWTSESGHTRRSYARVRFTLSEHLPGLLGSARAVLVGFAAAQGDQSELHIWLLKHWPGEKVKPPAGKLGQLQRERRADLPATLKLIETVESWRHRPWQT